MRRFAPVVFAVIEIAAVAGPSAASPGYYRQPDIHGDWVVFTAEEDLWLVNVTGGEPRRLTTHPGNESFAHFSPDGRWIAFTGSYDGNRDLFVIPFTGGEPRRLTWYPTSDECIGWTPDGKKIITRSGREHPFGWELYAVDVANGESERLPLGWAARLEIDPASGRWAFNRESRDFSTWKRYRGGTAPDI